MKKLLYLIVAGFIFVFSACGGGATTEEAATETTTEEAAPAAAAEAQDSADVAAEEAETEAETEGGGEQFLIGILLNKLKKAPFQGAFFIFQTLDAFLY